MYEHGFDEQHATGINSFGLNYIIQIVPIVANDTIDSTNDVNGCRKKRSGLCC